MEISKKLQRQIDYLQENLAGANLDNSGNLEIEDYTDAGGDMILSFDKEECKDLKKSFMDRLEDFDISEEVMVWWKNGKSDSVPFNNIKEHYEDVEEWLEEMKDLVKDMPDKDKEPSETEEKIHEIKVRMKTGYFNCGKATENMLKSKNEMAEIIHDLCIMLGGEIDFEEYGINDEFTTVCYDGDGDSEYADAYAVVKKVKAAETTADGVRKFFDAEVSGESCYATVSSVLMTFEEVSAIYDRICNIDLKDCLL